VTADLDADPARAIDLCRGAHQRLARDVVSLRDADARAPSRLPGWSVGHVLTHLARNADGHAHRLEAALRGEDAARYPGGPEQRAREIAEGAGRPAAELAADVAATSTRLESAWDECAAAGWPHASLLGSDAWPTTSSPVRRLREVEVHHLDLGLGYESAQWDDDYALWELGQVLAGLPGRLASAGQARDLVVWLTGRGPAPARLDLGAW
jgi:maleylpyruvate isomerase